jgi:hypothetical protein
VCTCGTALSEHSHFTSISDDNSVHSGGDTWWERLAIDAKTASPEQEQRAERIEFQEKQK